MNIRVRYRFEARAEFLGEMDIPLELFAGLPEDELWSDEIEQFIIDHHDYLHQPPEVDPIFDAEFDYVERAPGDAAP